MLFERLESMQDGKIDESSEGEEDERVFTENEDSDSSALVKTSVFL
jgi:hypothetical protein